ncbi:unnamed protein product [Urochloa decumbens]|uniref:Disease resistance protein At4g27190-like leucine-rich repeats domain-containing protein n=1 Tax=Urochloa decumbens TaxID=240449 RepID=A0ABC8W0F0_9POAL
MQRIRESSFEETVQKVISYLYASGDTNEKRSIYYDGWDGLAASAVLRAIAENPPPSLLKEFDLIIHVDCLRWKSQRALQRAIAEQLKLPQELMAVFDKQDEEDDFSGVDEGSRAALADATRGIYQATRNLSYLVILHNGSASEPDLASLGVAQHEWFSPNSKSKVLWTFRGMLRLNPELTRNMDDASHFYLKSERPSRDNPYMIFGIDPTVNPVKRFELEEKKGVLLLEEAKEVARYAQHEQIITPEIAAKCLLYFLIMNFHGSHSMDYNWAIHASNYWICDGIIQQDHLDGAWEASAALSKQIRMEDCSPRELFTSHDEDQKRWREATCIVDQQSTMCIVFVDGRWQWHTDSSASLKDLKESVSPELTSFFLSVQLQSGLDAVVLPSDMFQQSERLHVLKLCWCDFSFYSPPFRCCRSLRFLGLDHCKDSSGEEQEEKEQGRQPMEFFQNLWVLDISHMDWELDLIPSAIEQAAGSIRDVHVNKGRIWGSNLAWRQLQNLRKLRVIEPTSSWETGNLDEFNGMEKLELLDLSGNTEIQVLPSLSGATGLKTLVLDGCIGLERVGTDQLPRSLESFSLDAGKGGEAKLMCISMAGCTRLTDFIMRGSFARLEELDMSHTAVKTLDLRNPVVEAPHLQRVILLACERLRAILWPAKGMQQLRMLCIDTRGEAMEDIPSSSKKLEPQNVVLQMLPLWTNKEKTGQPLVESAAIPKASYNTYTDIAASKIPTTCSNKDSSATQLQPLDFHVEIGEGTSTAAVRSRQGIEAVSFVMNRVESLHLHDNFSIATVIPEHILFPTWDTEATVMWRGLKWCRVERCPKLDTVFIIPEVVSYLRELETFQAADLLTAHIIWRRQRPPIRRKPYIPEMDDIDLAPLPTSFGKLRSIHLHYCPRLVYVLPLQWFKIARQSYFPNLEAIHISCCGDLSQIFPMERRFESREGVEEFPSLKYLNLYELPKLQQICTSRILAPKLEAISLRGCWSLRRLPATNRDGGRPPVMVDCEKDWWEKLEWDGMDAGHHPSLFAPRHSMYYRKPRLLRGSVLR